MAAFCVASFLARDDFVWKLRNTALLPKRSNAKIQMATIFKIIFTLSVYWSWFWIRPMVIVHSERHWQCVWHPSEVSVEICCVICDVISWDPRRDKTTLRVPPDTVIGKRVTLWATMIDIRDHTHKGPTYIILSKTLNFLSEWSVFWTALFYKCPCTNHFGRKMWNIGY